MTASSLIFLLSTGFIVYVLAGYPLALAWWARRFPRPVHKEFQPRPITIVIPVRNGSAWIRAKIQSLLQSDYPPQLISILVSSDGSTDETNAIVENYGDARVKLLSLPPGGKATAVNKALEQVESEFIVLTDVRQPFDPLALQRLISCFADPAVGVVTGELVIRAGVTLGEYNTGLYWRYEKWIRGNLNRVDAMLGATGSIYAMRRQLAAEVPRDILLDDVYLPFVAVAKGARIYFESGAKAWDLPTSLRSEFRRKIRTQAGVYQIIRYFPWLLWPGNRRFIHFFSHKFGRLMLPFALIAVAISSAGLPSPWRMIAIAAQVLFYGAATIDPAVPEKTALKRITGVIRAFVVLVAAAFCALAVFVMPAQLLWKETKVQAARESNEAALK